MGKLLFVDLSAGEIREETTDENLCRDFVGGYGIGARILYSHQKGGVDPLGPDNTLGLITGPLTGTPAIGGSRYQVVAKSPLTGGWGDANSGGHFGPKLKFAGYDGVFFTGISDKPVYLLVDNGKAELKDASYLWGKDTYETEDTLKAEYRPRGRSRMYWSGRGETLSPRLYHHTQGKRCRPLGVRRRDGIQETQGSGGQGGQESAHSRYRDG